jgi:hypothetical protein
MMENIGVLVVRKILVVDIVNFVLRVEVVVGMKWRRIVVDRIAFRFLMLIVLIMDVLQVNL